MNAGYDSFINKWINPATIFAIAGILIIHFFFIINYTIDFPILDDYNAIFKTIFDWKASATWSEKLKTLFALNNEHRIVSIRLFALLQYGLIGRVSIFGIVIVANIMLVASLVILSVFFKKSGIRYWQVASVCFFLLMLNLNTREATSWAMAGFSFFSMFLSMSLAVFFYFSRSRFSLPFSILFAFIATFSTGGGWFIFPILILSDYFSNSKVSRKALVMLLAAIGALALFLKGFHITNAGPGLWQTISANPLSYLRFIISVFGGVLADSPSVAFIAGLFLIPVGVYLLWISRKHKGLQPLWALGMVMAIMLGIIAITRYQGTWTTGAAHRHIPIVVLWVGIIFGLALAYANKKMWGGKLIIIMLISSVSIWAYGYNTFWRDQVYKKRQFDKQVALVSQGEISNFNYGWPVINVYHAKKMLQQANELGIFKFNWTEETILLEGLQSERTNEAAFVFLSKPKFGGSSVSVLVLHDSSFLPTIGWMLGCRDMADSVHLFPLQSGYEALPKELTDEKETTLKHIWFHRYYMTDLERSTLSAELKIWVSDGNVAKLLDVKIQ